MPEMPPIINFAPETSHKTNQERNPVARMYIKATVQDVRCGFYVHQFGLKSLH